MSLFNDLLDCLPNELLHYICELIKLQEINIEIMLAFPRFRDIYKNKYKNIIALYEITKDNLDGLIDVCYQISHVKCAIYQNKKYYEYKNPWRLYEQLDRPDYDQDITYSHPFRSEIIPNNPFDVNYELLSLTQIKNRSIVKFREEISSNLKTFRKSILNDNCNKILENIVTKLIDSDNLDINKTKNIVLYCKHDIHLENINGINYDCRGANRCQLNLPFHNDIEIKTPISLYDFTTELYRLKSHKFDKWYELYCNAKTSIEDNILFGKLSFDHGS